MPRLLILLTLPPDVTDQYRARYSRAFPELAIDVVASRDNLGSALAQADVLLTFGQMMKNLKLDFNDATNLKWVQALGTGLDGIVDQPALRQALLDGAIGGAALDVTNPEPLPADDPLLEAPNLIVVPHLGSATEQTRVKMAELAVDGLLSGLAGERPHHLVNPDAWERRRR